MIALVAGPLGALGLAALTTAFSALLVGERRRAGLLAVLLLPLSVPVLLAGSTLADPDRGGVAWLALLVGYDALVLITVWAVYLPCWRMNDVADDQEDHRSRRADDLRRGADARLVVAPTDAFQGESQRLMFVHVPAASTAYLLRRRRRCRALYLIHRDVRHDRVAQAAAAWASG